MTLRSLYNYVIKTITRKRKMENTDKEMSEDKIDLRSSVLSSDGGLPPVSEDEALSSSKRKLMKYSIFESTKDVLTSNQQQQQQFDHTITYRERLGGYLHPRDMRRLVTPFSSSNEPELIVRRHVMLLNFDPLRAIVMRDRMLLLVPDGADSILMSLERNIRGGVDEDVFGDEGVSSTSKDNGEGNVDEGIEEIVEELATAVDSVIEGINELDEETFGKKSDTNLDEDKKDKEEGGDDDLTFDSQEDVYSEKSLEYDNEWDDIEGMNWIELPYELQCVDAVLSSVVKMLTDDASNLRHRILGVMEQLRGGESSGAAAGDHTQEKLRLLKDEVKEMESRVQGFVRAISNTLDEDEDMALMNLSRIITHPERFIQPVSQEILNEESDEPELILEAHLQQALSEVNALELLKGQILNTEELVSLQMDTIRNRLLYINTVVSLASLSVAISSLIGSIFGMNLINHLEDDEHAFGKVVTGTVVGMVCFLVIFLWVISRTGLMPTNPRKAWYIRNLSKRRI